MKYSINLLILFLSINAISQIDKPSSANHCNEEGTYWFETNNELRKLLQLENIKTSDKKFYFRLWTDFYCIDIWIDDSNTKLGSIITWTHESSHDLANMTNKIFSHKYNLEIDQISRIIETTQKHIFQTEINSDSTKIWEQTESNILFTIEYKIEENYYYKSIFDSNNNLNNYISSNYEHKISETAKIDSIWNEFYSIIPFKYFSKGECIEICFD